MNCSNCSLPIENNARFCRNCGAPVSSPAQPPASSANPLHQFEGAETIPTMPWQAPAQQQPAPPAQLPQQMPTQYMPSPQNVPQQYAEPTQQMYQVQNDAALQQRAFQQQGQPSQPGTFANNASNTAGSPEKVAPRRRRGRGCFSGCLVTVIVLVLLIVGGWFLLARPYLHNVAATQISNVLTTSINQIPSQVSQVPAGVIPVQENVLNNLIVLESAPSDPVQHMQVSITPTNMTITFSVYGYGCTVTGVPTAQNGHLVMTSVNVQGLASLIMSSDELTTLLNQKLAEAQAKLDHPITGVQLKDQEVDLVLGPPGSV